MVKKWRKSVNEYFKYNFYSFFCASAAVFPFVYYSLSLSFSSFALISFISEGIYNLDTHALIVKDDEAEHKK